MVRYASDFIGYFQMIENVPHLSNNTSPACHSQSHCASAPFFSGVSFSLHSAVAKDKDKQSFKLRAGMDKKIVIYVQQTSNKELAIER